MADELMGKIYFSVDDENWYSDTSEPVLHGFHFLDYVSTNRWPYIISQQQMCKNFLEQENNLKDPSSRFLPLVELAEKLTTLDYHTGKDDYHFYQDDIFLPASFDPFNCYLIDILLYLGIKLNVIDKSDAAALSREWTNGEIELNLDFEKYKSATVVTSKINNVIELLVNKKIRIGAVSEQPVTKYPDNFNENDFPEIEKLRFTCYSPRY